MNGQLLGTARLASGLGISVVPPSEDGAKRPLPGGIGEWKRYQDARATEDEIGSWYGPRTGVGFVCGAISRGLELFEFDDRETYERFKDAAAEANGAEIIDAIEAGYLEETPGGGVHWFYYASEIRSSAKLAVRRIPSEDGGRAKVKTLIETKGEGGYVIVSPSFGRVHPTGMPYRLIRGGLETIATITDEERHWLWDLAKTFDDGEPDAPAPEAEVEVVRRFVGGWEDTVSPGDDFSGRTKWPDILTGWTMAYRHGETEFWRRPDKTFGHSATINHTGKNRLHVFTSSSEFEPNVSYSRFGAYAVLEHRGDFTNAAKALYSQGYGTHKRWERHEHKWVLGTFPNPCPKGSKIAKPGEPPPGGSVPIGSNGDVAIAVSVPATVAANEKTGDDLGDFDGMSDEDLGLVSAHTIEPEPISWEWDSRVARGKLNLVAGEGGDGKSQIAIAVIAAVTSGGLFPDGSGPATAGTCFILAAEDGARDTIIPRLMAAGADLMRVKINNARVSFKDKNGKVLIHPVSFQDLSYWRVVLTRHKVRVLIADPVPAYLGRGVNDHRNNEVRAVLEPFVDLLDELGVALIAITHLNKSTDQKTPTHKILGSVAYSNLARTVHCTYRDPDDAERRFYCMVKSNIVAPQPSLAFRIKPVDFEHKGNLIKTSKVEFEGAPVDFSPAAMMNGKQQAGTPGPNPAKSLKNAEFLYDFLFGLGWVPLAQIIERAGEMGILGEQKEDGKWSCVTNLYRAQDRVLELPEPRHGFTVDVEKMAYRGYGKITPHWKLSPIDLPEREVTPF